jgi:DNA-binding NarL/FixJ family response regulator
MNKKNKINIFIVEDNKVFTIALKAYIETSFANIPIQIHSFETGETCIEKFNEEKPQIVILDYYLNSEFINAADGIHILDWIKNENPDTSVIMLTSEDTLDIATKSIKHGASDYIVKTNTQFEKINFSLSNLLKMIKAKSDARKYKYSVVLFECLLLLVIATVITIAVFYPSLL